MKIPFLSFEKMHADVREGLENSFRQTLDSNWFILGERLRNFEAEYSAWSKVKHTIGLSNGLDALHLSLLACGIGKGDEVIVPSNTYIATLLAVSMCGAKPVLCEPDPKTFNLNPAEFLKHIGPRTRAVIPVHLFGQACEMHRILPSAREARLMVIEDNAQSQGAACNGKLTGTFGDANATSFYPGKNLGALGDAGAITTDDDAIAEQIHMLRNYGSAKKYYNEIKGFNCRLDEMQAGFLSVKLKKLDEWTRERIQIAGWYGELLNGIPDLQLPQTAEGCTHVYHLYVIRHPKRDALQAWLESKGIGTLIHYPLPPHLQKAYSELGYRKGDFPIAEQMADSALSLPLYPGLSKEKVEYIADAIQSFPA